MQQIYSYIRVSATDQNEGRQLNAMREVHVPEKNIFVDKQSGKDFDRPQYKKCFNKKSLGLMKKTPKCLEKQYLL